VCSSIKLRRVALQSDRCEYRWSGRSPHLPIRVNPVGLQRAEAFSHELEKWLDDDTPKSIQSLGEVFAEKGFAVTILVLMIVSAIPLPTGGITQVFQMISALLAIQMIAGRRTIWLPKRWGRRELGQRTTHTAIPFLVRRIRWFEKHSHPRLAGLFHRSVFLRFVGVVLTAFAITAALAPPFSGLDTLPSMGAVIVALAVILEDVVLLVFGIVIGSGGIAVFVIVGAAIARAIGDFFN
jgi:hypothetical protein